MNLRSLENDLIRKNVALNLANRAIQIFTKADDKKSLQEAISEKIKLENQIKTLEKQIAKAKKGR